MSTAAQVLVSLHVVCVVFGFGYLAYSGLHLTLASRTSGAVTAGLLDVDRQVGALAELLIYGAFLFGLAAVGANSKHWGFGQAWLSAGFALYLLDVAILHGWIRRSQRRYLALARRLASDPDQATAASLDRMAKRVATGWGVFNLVVVAVIVLMVVRPS